MSGKIAVVGGASTDLHVLGVALFSLIVDDGNFKPATMKHTNEMEAIAEALTPPERVYAMLAERADSSLAAAKRRHLPIREARELICSSLERLFTVHYYELDEAHDEVVARHARQRLVGYQKWWRKVNRRAERLVKGGTYAELGIAKVKALEEINPELYPPAGTK